MKFILLLAFLSVARADGPNLKIHSWVSNGTIHAGVHIPACHYARFERTLLLQGTNTVWLAADYAEEEYFTRLVVFRDRMVFTNAFYRVQAIYVKGCPTLK